MKVQASDRTPRRLDDLQASLGDVMTRINRLEGVVRLVSNICDAHIDAIKLHGNLIQDLTKRVNALGRNDS